MKDILGKLRERTILSGIMILLTICVVASFSGCILASANAEWKPNKVPGGGSTDGYVWVTNNSPLTLTVTKYVNWVRDPDGMQGHWVTGLLGASRDCPPSSRTMIVHVEMGIALSHPPGTYTYHYTITFTEGQTTTCDATITITSPTCDA